MRHKICFVAREVCFSIIYFHRFKSAETEVKYTGIHDLCRVKRKKVEGIRPTVQIIALFMTGGVK